jgi:Cof subfamily protein (haloacid dehalogenase superfamily)
MFDCKLICTDIDGTLLNSEHRISKENKKAIQLAVKNNIIVALVSGRIGGSLAVLQRELGITGPLGCYSGSLVLDGRDVLASHPISNAQGRKIIAALQGSGLQAIVFGKDDWFIDKSGKWQEKEARVSLYEGTVCDFTQLFDTWEKEGKSPYKILCMGEDPALIETMEKQLSTSFGNELNVFRSSPKYLEISAKGIDKGHAVHAICKKYGFSPSQVMAVGDFYNDLGMFREAGYSVAMGNAPPDIKAQADSVTLSNDENGLALAIEAIL